MMYKKVERTNFREYQNDKFIVKVLNEINFHTNMSMFHRVEFYLNPDLDENKRYAKNIDLYNDLAVKAFIEEASLKLKVSTGDINQAIQGISKDIEESRLAYQETNKEINNSTITISQAEKEEAEAYLSDKLLLSNLLSDIETLGIYGNKKEILLQYFSMLSRQGNNPLVVVGSGQTDLTNGLVGLVPQESKEDIGSWSPNALYFYGNTLQRKLLVIRNGKSVLNNQNELAQLSKGEIKKAITAKTKSGKIGNVTATTIGGASIVILSEESNRFDNPNFIHLRQNPDVEIIKRTLAFQKRREAGLIDMKYQARIKTILINIQRLIKPIDVIIPMALQMDFQEGIKDQVIVERQFFSLVKTICLFRQYQKDIKKRKGTKETYIEASKEDVELAMELFQPVLQNIEDDLKPETRSAWINWCQILKSEKQDSFSSKEFKNALNLYPMLSSRILKELREHNYIDLESKTPKEGNVFSVRKMFF